MPKLYQVTCSEDGARRVTRVRAHTLSAAAEIVKARANMAGATACITDIREVMS